MKATELARYLGAVAGEVDGTRVLPMLCEREGGAASLGQKGWLYELKLDGVRILADKRGGVVKLGYRKLRDATASYPEIAAALAKLEEERVVLDGEIVAFDDEGRPDFQRLATRIHGIGARRPVPVMFVVFDVLEVGGLDVRGFPIEARKEVLAKVMDGVDPTFLRVHSTFSEGTALFDFCKEHRLEGVVAKKLGSPYRTGERGLDWRKVKCELDAELVVIGWTEGESTRSRLGALDLGVYDGDELVFRGRVGSGLDEATIEALLAWLVPNEVDEPVAKGKYPPKPKRHHCKPELVVSVRYGGLTRETEGVGPVLRFPVFRGIRPDVDARDCVLSAEAPWPTEHALPKVAQESATRRPAR